MSELENLNMQGNIRLRISVMGLFIKSDSVLMIHKMTGPQPDQWDLPGGGLQPGEPILSVLQREIQEEIGLSDLQVQSFLVIVEDFFPNWRGQLLHSLSIVYRCTAEGEALFPSGADGEVGSKGIQWLSVAALAPNECSNRSWKALQAAGMVCSSQG